MSIIIVLVISLFLVTEMVTGVSAFKAPIRTVKDGHGKTRKICKNKDCGGYGDGWGSLGGYCSFCKHDADVGCKCILNGCDKIYWAKSQSEKRLANARGRQA